MDRTDELTPWRVKAEDPQMAAVLALIRDSFAYMEARIDPPSSFGQMTLAQAQAHAGTHEIWAIGQPPRAAFFLTIEAQRLYLGRLAVAHMARRQGLARRLFALAEERARAHGLLVIELGSRVELVENHAVFQAVGYQRFAESSHPGFDRPTTYWFRKAVTAT